MTQGPKIPQREESAMPKQKDPKPNPLAAQFLLALVDRSILQAYDLMAGLGYPIPDHKTFEERLRACQSAGRSDRADPSPQPDITWLPAAFGPADFPIETPQGGLEKLTAALSAFPAEPDLGRPPLQLPDPRDEPDTTPQSPFFGTDPCGRAAQGRYRELLARFAGFPGANRAAYNDAQDFAARCRARLPDFTGDCAAEAARAWAECYADDLSLWQCNEAAQRVQLFCDLWRPRFPVRRRPFPRFRLFP